MTHRNLRAAALQKATSRAFWKTITDVFFWLTLIPLGFAGAVTVVACCVGMIDKLVHP